MKKNGQTLVEYILIAALVAIIGYAFVAKFDLSKVKNYVFMRPNDSQDSTKVKIEAMTP